MIIKFKVFKVCGEGDDLKSQF